MTKINVQELYPFSESIEVSDEILNTILEFEHKEDAYQRKIRRYKAYYSLDSDQMIERISSNPDIKIKKKRLSKKKLQSSFQLTVKQADRIYAHYYLGISQSAIAKMEGTTRQSVSESIELGLKKIKKILENDSKIPDKSL